MAIFHLSVKTIGRSAGRSATAAAAYRAGVEIEDTRTGEVHDYTRKGGVESADIFTPADAPEWASDRSDLWNKAEAAEKRINSTVAREFIVALPDELDADARARLAHDLAREIVERHRCAVDVAIHEPGREGDTRNHHAHLLLTTRRLESTGFTEKTRELDQAKAGEVPHWRERWAALTNDALEQAGRPERVDHRTLEAQGIEDREPTRHLGPTATAIERRTQAPSARRQEGWDQARASARDARELERETAAVSTEIRDLSGALETAKGAAAGLASWKSQFEQERQRQAQEEAKRQAAEQERQRQTDRDAQRAADREAQRQAQEAKQPPKAQPKQKPAREKEGWSR